MNLNQTTQLEAQLRSWVPRPPSPALKPRLFAPAAASRRQAPEASGAASLFTQHATRITSLFLPAAAPGLRRLAWLAPATAVLALFSLLAAQRPPSSFSRATGSGAVLALALSNQNASASLSAALSNDQYTLPPESLAATNLRSLTSTFSPRSLSGTTN